MVNQVQETSLYPDCNDLCDKMISSWSHKGVAGESSPKLLLMTPCGEKDHTPVPPEPGVLGKGYFLISGSRLSSGRVELIKAAATQTVSPLGGTAWRCTTTSTPWRLCVNRGRSCTLLCGLIQSRTNVGSTRTPLSGPTPTSPSCPSGGLDLISLM